MSVHLCRCWMSGTTSICLTIDAELKKELGLLPRDVIGFRVVNSGGKKLLVGEKVPMHQIAVLKTMPENVIKKDT